MEYINEKNILFIEIIKINNKMADFRKVFCMYHP
jgi:hypothetical protein